MTPAPQSENTEPQAAAPELAEPAKKKPRVKRAGGAKKESKKRAAARPYRKLAQEVLDGRIAKLGKRIAVSAAKLQEAQGFLAKYTREQDIRSEPQPAEPQAVETLPAEP